MKALIFPLSLKRINSLKKKKDKSHLTLIEGGQTNYSTNQKQFLKEILFDLEINEFLVLYLFYWYNFSIKDLSICLEISEETVEGLIKSGVSELNCSFKSTYKNWIKNLKKTLN